MLREANIARAKRPHTWPTSANAMIAFDNIVRLAISKDGLVPISPTTDRLLTVTRAARDLVEAMNSGRRSAAHKRYINQLRDHLELALKAAWFLPA